MSLGCDLNAKLSGIATFAVVTESDDSKGATALMVQDFEDQDPFQTELVQPCGVNFRPAVGAEVLLLAPGGESANALAMGGQDRSRQPADGVAEGEGGLHFLGEYRVFLDADGLVHLGEKAGADFVALAAKVDAELAAIKMYIDTHVHPTGMGPTSAPLPMTAPGSVAATKVKAT